MRGEWKERRLPTDVSKPIHVDLPISAPGAFCYFLEFDGPTASSPRVTGRRGYFNVDPIITVPARTPFFPLEGEIPVHPLRDESSGTVLQKNTSLPLDGLIILSVLAKWMGNTGEWHKMFAEASRRGYNMLHWVPLQQRGASGSPYSIFDQLKFDNALLVDPKAADDGLAEVEKALKMAKAKYGLGGITDVVLNHTAFDSEWLHEHPEAGPLKRIREPVADYIRLFRSEHASSCTGSGIGRRPSRAHGAIAQSRGCHKSAVIRRCRRSRPAHAVSRIQQAIVGVLRL